MISSNSISNLQSPAVMLQMPPAQPRPQPEPAPAEPQPAAQATPDPTQGRGRVLDISV